MSVVTVVATNSEEVKSASGRVHRDRDVVVATPNNSERTTLLVLDTIVNGWFDVDSARGLKFKEILRLIGEQLKHIQLPAPEFQETQVRSVLYVR